MTRLCTLAALLWGCVVWSPAPRAMAAEDILRLIPDSAWGLMIINHPHALDAKIQAILRRMDLPMPSLLELLKLKVGLVDGLAVHEPAALLFLPPETAGKDPGLILFIPVNDYNQFVGQLKPEDVTQPVTRVHLLDGYAWVRHVGGYAAFAGLQYRHILEHGIKVSAEIPAHAASWKEWLAGQDLAGVILSTGMKSALVWAQQEVQKTKALMESSPATRVGAGALDIYARFLHAAENEIASVGFGLCVDDNGAIHFVNRVTLVPGGPWDQTLALIPPPQQNLLDGLPAGRFVMAGGGAFSQDLLETWNKFQTGLMNSVRDVYGMNQEQIDKLTEFASRSKVEGLRSASMVLAPPGNSGLMTGGAIIVVRVDRSDAFMASYQNNAQQYREFVNRQADANPYLMAPELHDSEVIGMKALQVIVRAPSPTSYSSNASNNSLMAAWLGPGNKHVAWIVPFDEHTVVIGYFNKDYLRRTIESMKQHTPGLAADPDVAKTVALLPAGANWVAYYSPAGLLPFIRRLPNSDPAAATLLARLPAFPPSPPLGFALTTGAHELSTHTAIPAELLPAARQYVDQLKSRGLFPSSSTPADR